MGTVVMGRETTFGCMDSVYDLFALRDRLSMGKAGMEDGGQSVFEYLFSFTRVLCGDVVVMVMLL